MGVREPSLRMDDLGRGVRRNKPTLGPWGNQVLHPRLILGQKAQWNEEDTKKTDDNDPSGRDLCYSELKGPT